MYALIAMTLFLVLVLIDAILEAPLDDRTQPEERWLEEFTKQKDAA